MSITDFNRCPGCGSPLHPGFVGPTAWLRWFDTRQGLGSFFGWFSGSSLSSRIVETTPGRRCLGCGLVMFSSDTVSTRQDREVDRPLRAAPLAPDVEP